MTYPTQVAGKKRPHLPKKPTVFTESSTTRWDGNDGVAQYGLDRGIDPSYAIPRDAINADLTLEGSPLIRLTGDEFCSNAESFIWLGQDKNILVGGGTLTENNTPTYVLETSDDESPLYEQNVGNLVAGSSQYWSFPTAASVQVGTNSFMFSIAFKTSIQSTLQYMVFYGDLQATKQNWQIYFDPSGILSVVINDGTNSVQLQDPTRNNRWADGREHIATVIVDRTSNLMYLICDGVNLGNVGISAVTGTLTLAASNLLIGASNNNGTKANFFNGNLSLCKIINNAADYNVPQVWNMGIREAVSSGTFTAGNQSANRLNNYFQNGGSNNEYFYATVFTEDGEYELQQEYQTGSNYGISQIIIDQNIISTTDQYTSGSVSNNIKKTFGLKLSAGRHTIKFLANGKNASSSNYFIVHQWINFIKRRGHENNGVDDFLLLGDEITERNTATINLIASGTEFYNSQLFWTSPSNGQYVEGSLFIKGGLYRIDYISLTNTNLGMFDLWFGDVQVLSQYDEYAGSATHNVVKTVYVRLQQGRQDIRLAANGKNASSSGYDVALTCIRGTRLSD